MYVIRFCTNASNSMLLYFNQAYRFTMLDSSGEL